MKLHLKANERGTERVKIIHDGHLGFSVVVERDGITIRAKCLGEDANPKQTSVVYTEDIDVEVLA